MLSLCLVLSSEILCVRNTAITVNNQRGSHVSLSWFSCGSSNLVELEFGDVGFSGGRKTGKTVGARREPTNELNPFECAVND